MDGTSGQVDGAAAQDDDARAWFDALPDIAVIVDPRGTIRRANRMARLFLGGDGGIGRNTHELLHARDETAGECAICDRTAGRGAISVEVESREGVWHRIALRPLPDGNALQVSRDVTDDVAIKQTWQRRALSYRILLDNLPQAVFLRDTESRLVSCNSVYARYLGKGPEELCGQWLRDLYPAELAASLEQEDRTVCATGEPIEFDRALTLHGTAGVFHTLKIPLKDDEGAVFGVLGIFWDVTEEKQAEQAERERQLVYQALLKHAADAILVSDAQGRFLDANHRAEEMFGYTRDELLCMGPRDIHPPANRERRAAAFQDMDVKGSSLFEHPMVRKDGTTFFAEVSVTRVPWGDSHIYLGHFRDITERRRNEAELTAYREGLERRVQERTRELVAMNRELEAFSYSVSHDLRSPLRAINGFGAALREELGATLSPDAANYLDRMRLATVRMGELIDGLLDLSQVSRSDVIIAPVDLGALAVAHLATLREGDSQRLVRVTIAPHLVTDGDPTLLRILIENLLNNAWKFTRKCAEARIDVGRAITDEGEAFFVRDNGAGFEQEFAHKLFQPFERLHAHDEFQGTGIGLATVRRIVERHGGRVWAEGTPNQGSTIFFTLGAPAP